MEDDPLTLSREPGPERPRGRGRAGERWRDVEARLDEAVRRPAFDPYARYRAKRVARAPTGLIVAAVVALVFCIGFVSAPLLAFRAVRAAAQYGDAQALAELVDYAAVRESLRVQLRPGSVEQKPPVDLLHHPLQALRRAWEPAGPQGDVDPYLTPNALAALSEGRGRAPPAPPPGGLYGGPVPRVRYWGFDRTRLGVADPADARRETLFTFKRRGLFDWKLVGIRLPQAPA